MNQEIFNAMFGTPLKKIQYPKEKERNFPLYTHEIHTKTEKYVQELVRKRGLDRLPRTQNETKSKQSKSGDHMQKILPGDHHINPNVNSKQPPSNRKDISIERIPNATQSIQSQIKDKELRAVNSNSSDIISSQNLPKPKPTTTELDVPQRTIAKKHKWPTKVNNVQEQPYPESNHPNTILRNPGLDHPENIHQNQGLNHLKNNNPVMDHHSAAKNKSENTSNTDNINLKSSPKIHPSNALIEGIFNKIKVSEVSGCATKPLIDETTDLRTRSNKGEFHDNKISNTEYKPTKIESFSYQNNESSGLLRFGTGEGSSKVKVNHKVPHNDSRLPQNIDESLDILQRLKSRKSFEKIQNTLFSNPSNQSKFKSHNRPLQQQESTLHPFSSDRPDNVNGPANSLQHQRPLKIRRGLTLAEQEEEKERKNARKNYYRNQKIIDRQREEEKRRLDKRIPCSFYQKLGRCNNGDACRFSHDIEIIKTDVCKFYLTGACLKGKNCIYYHGEWPCKFFHLKGFCKEGDNCKFSHQPMTDQMKKLFDDRTEFEKSQKQMVESDSNIKSSNELQSDQTEEVSFTTITAAITSPAAITTPDAENQQPSTESTAPVVNPIDLLPSLYSDLS